MSTSDYQPAVLLPVNVRYINGLEIANSATVPNTTVTVAAGSVMDSTNTFQISSSTAMSAINTTTGAGALDTGTVAASTGYFIHIIADTFGVNATTLLLSTSSSSPIMPYGYDLRKMLGWVRTDGSSHFLTGLWSGSGVQRLFMYDAPLATTITAGAATTVAEVPLSGLVPANFLNMPVWMYAVVTGDAASRTLSVRPYGNTGYPIVVTTQVTSVAVSPTFRVQSRLNSTTPSLQYVWNTGTNTAAFSVAGYEYYLNQ